MTERDVSGLVAAQDVIAILGAVEPAPGAPTLHAVVDALPAERARRALRLLALLTAHRERDLIDRLAAGESGSI